MSKKYGIVIDIDKCTGCYACSLACKDENCEQEFPGYTAGQPMTGQFWLTITEVERGTFPKVKVNHVPRFCNHCDNPGCMGAATDGAVYKREDGVVIIDPVKAKGQKQIINACPHRMVYWNDEKQLPQKCDMCAHFMDQGYKKPRCVEMCPTGALIFGDMNDSQSEISKIIAEKKPVVTHPEYGLNENVLYIGLPKKFITGTVIYKDTDQCAKDVAVKLSGQSEGQSAGQRCTRQTDAFGDFWFDGLDNRTDYTVEIAAAGYNGVTLKARTLNDVNLGEIFLEK